MLLTTLDVFTGSKDKSIGYTDLNAQKNVYKMNDAHKKAINTMLIWDENTLCSGDDLGCIKVLYLLLYLIYIFSLIFLSSYFS
jgi:hypothetical protein